jgi:hypothetical protein
LLYSVGIAAVAAGKYENLYGVLIDAKGRLTYPTRPLPLASVLHPEAVVLDGWAQRALAESQTYYLPRSEYFYRLLREPLKDIVPLENHYEEVFDRFEYLFALVNADQKVKQKLTNQPRRFSGRFFWRNADNPDEDIMSIVYAEVQKQGKDWPPLRAGFFDGSLDTLEERRQQLQGIVQRWRANND